MKKAFVMMAAASTMAFAVPALADVDEGRIKEMKNWSLQLDRAHQFYTAGNPAILEQLKIGDRVRVTFVETPDAQKQIVKVEKLSDE